MISRISITHPCLDIELFIKNTKSDDEISWIKSNEGNTLTNRQVIALLMMHQDKGHKFHPVDECDNFDYQTGCRGHDVTLLVHDYEFEEGNG